MGNDEYFIERFEGGKSNFNIWKRIGNKYHNVATLFYQDRMCGNQWDISEVGKSVSYDKSEIQDETEGQLTMLPQAVAERLLTMKNNSPDEAALSLEEILK